MIDNHCNDATDTISVLLDWLFLYMSIYPHLMQIEACNYVGVNPKLYRKNQWRRDNRINKYFKTNITSAI